jgi:TATA-binding protein-associated factor
MYTARPLVASSGQEYTLPSSFSSVHDVKKAKKEAMKRLGLDFLEGVDDTMDWEKELGGDGAVVSPDGVTPKVEDVKMETLEATIPSTSKPALPPTAAHEPSPEPMAGMSARELNRLKRKRKGGNVTVMAVPPKQAADARFNVVQAQDSSPKWVGSSDPEFLPNDATGFE